MLLHVTLVAWDSSLVVSDERIYSFFFNMNIIYYDITMFLFNCITKLRFSTLLTGAGALRTIFTRAICRDCKRRDRCSLLESLRKALIRKWWVSDRCWLFPVCINILSRCFGRSSLIARCACDTIIPSHTIVFVRTPCMCQILHPFWAADTEYMHPVCSTLATSWPSYSSCTQLRFTGIFACIIDSDWC